MNKLTATLAGLAAVAVASAVPAAAQGNFTADGPFTFTYSPTAFSVNSIAATYNPMVSGTSDEMGTLSITGGTSTNGLEFTGGTLSFVTGGQTLTQTVDSFVAPMGGGADFISGFAPATAFSRGFTYDLFPGTPNAAPVPEASTVLSFGALLALGGLAVLRRKSAVKTAA